MEHKETERTVIAKPVASRPSASSFRSFSELLAGAINVSSSSEPTITAIRPKTVRFKPVVSSPPVKMVSSQEELVGSQACHLSNKVSKSKDQSPLIYKPLAKTVSGTTISLLANMGTFNTNHEQAVAKNSTSESETLKDINTPESPVKSRNDKRPQSHTNNGDRPSYDGYNWRKYGQKQVKGSEYPRSYYKCTHPNCPVKKKVEKSIDGEIAEIVYKGEHNHVKPRFPRRHTFDGTSQISNGQLNDSNEGSEGGAMETKANEVLESSSRLTNLVKVPGPSDALGASMPNLDRSYGVNGVLEGSKVMMEIENDEPTSKKMKILNQVNEAVAYGEGLQEPRIVVQNGGDSEIVSDGFRWRKYGQKVVKGNPYPRSYYRCTGPNKCEVRKHVERASDDPTVFITTYEGKHNHEMPLKKTHPTS